MNHPDPGSWSNYVRGLLGPETATGMERHLTRGCASCEQQVRALRATHRVAEIDRRFQPPAFAVTSVKRLLRLHALAGSDETSRLLDLELAGLLDRDNSARAHSRVAG